MYCVVVIDLDGYCVKTYGPYNTYTRAFETSEFVPDFYDANVYIRELSFI